MRSIRTFLVVVIVSVVCLSNFIAALQGYRDSLSAVDKIEEQQLLESLATLKTLFDHHVDIPSDLFSDVTLFQIWSQGQLQAASSHSSELLSNNRDEGFHLTSYDGYQWLVYRFNDRELDLYITVASKSRVYSSLTEEILILAILPIIWILPVIAILVWVIVNVGTKPIKQLAVKLSFREVNDFSSLKSDRYASELEPIVSSLNGLFDRLSYAFERERRFSADAAHELRTPLAALKVNLHNLSKEQKDNDILWALQRTADRMEHSIEQLLSLHRVALDEDSNEITLCDLHSVAQDVIAEVYERLASKQQTIELVGKATEINIKGDVSSVAILLRNLIDNASKYTPDQGAILVTINSNNNSASMLIEDSGPGIDKDEYARVLERFYRVGGDRNNSKVVGSGLGLSIVSDIVRIHRGKINLSRSQTLGGLAIEVTFPIVNSAFNNENL